MLANCISAAAVASGGLLGAMLRRSVDEHIKDAVMTGLGLYVIYLGIKSLSFTVNAVLLLLSVVLGALLGAALRLDERMNRGAARL
ncbi:MAG: DUF554 family protein, partial [Oscillospiraceae bacterium]|nr:DUF554 family protein [Oscillospiraceae bacterium]